MADVREVGEPLLQEVKRSEAPHRMVIDCDHRHTHPSKLLIEIYHGDAALRDHFSNLW